MKRALVAIVAGLLAATGLVTTTTAPASAHGSHHHARVGYTQVAVAPAVFDLITSAGITPAPTGGAKAFAYKGTLAARFLITGYRLSGLQIRHSGGISLTAGAATISLADFNIDLARLRVSGVVEGTVGNVGRVDLFKIRVSDRPTSAWCA
jgi:hypothetical protein